ncbi:MAG: hypothetical protein II839_00865 [Kiritimatiellae bacterium]|nr:hypothetical protein [Kiritimatiellia bacterium]
MNRSAPVDSPWPLEDGERVLWEGAPDATPTKDARALVRRGVVWAVIAAALFAALLVWRLGFGDEIVLHPADPSLGDVVFSAEPVDGALALFVVLVPLHLLLFFFPFFERRRLRNARFALTDRRLLRRIGAKPPNAIPLSDIDTAGRDAPDDLGRVRLRVFRRSRPLRSFIPAEHHPWIGPFPPAVADAFDAALRSALGLPPTTDAPERTPGHCGFPSWMDERERKRIAASLAPGERLLWCGRPAGTIPALIWILWAGLLGFLLCGFACIIRLEDVPSVVSRFLETERLLFVRFGGVGGWMAGIVLGLFAVFHAVVPLGLFILAEEPWRFRRGARCTRYLVSDRRTWHMLSSPSPNAGRTAMLPLLDGGGLPWKPVVRRAGSGRSDVFFRPLPGKTFDPERVSKWNATGFLDLPDADVPAALAALEELRNSAAR